MSKLKQVLLDLNVQINDPNLFIAVYKHETASPNGDFFDTWNLDHDGLRDVFGDSYEDLQSYRAESNQFFSVDAYVVQINNNGQLSLVTNGATRMKLTRNGPSGNGDILFGVNGYGGSIIDLKYGDTLDYYPELEAYNYDILPESQAETYLVLVTAIQ